MRTFYQDALEEYYKCRRNLEETRTKLAKLTYDYQSYLPYVNLPTWRKNNYTEEEWAQVLKMNTPMIGCKKVRKELALKISVQKAFVKAEQRDLQKAELKLNQLIKSYL